jgi:hypothetical protein
VQSYTAQRLVTIVNTMIAASNGATDAASSLRTDRAVEKVARTQYGAFQGEVDQVVSVALSSDPRGAGDQGGEPEGGDLGERGRGEHRARRVSPVNASPPADAGTGPALHLDPDPAPCAPTPDMLRSVVPPHADTAPTRTTPTDHPYTHAKATRSRLSHASFAALAAACVTDASDPQVLWAL